jgi:LysR family transcriptional regulator, transcriptional activator for aaeXAB operon
MPVQRIDALSIFAKVGELGSISGAARALGLPKANVSRAVASLEADYTVVLIERGARRVTLTEIGAKLHARCERLIAEVEAADAEIASYRGEPSGLLRVGCPATVVPWLASNLADFLERYPDIDLRIKVGDRLLPETQALDVVLHAGWLADSALKARKISDIPTIFVASHHYAETHGLPETTSDLARHAVIGNFYAELSSFVGGPDELPARVPQLELVRGRERMAVQAWRRFISNDARFILALVRRGVAIGPVAAHLIARELSSGALMRVLPEYEIADQPALYAVHSSGVSGTPKLRAFLDFAVERSRVLPPIY